MPNPARDLLIMLKSHCYYIYEKKKYIVINTELEKTNVVNIGCQYGWMRNQFTDIPLGSSVRNLLNGFIDGDAFIRVYDTFGSNQHRREGWKKWLPPPLITFHGEYTHAVDALLLSSFAYVTTQIFPKGTEHQQLSSNLPSPQYQTVRIEVSSSVNWAAAKFSDIPVWRKLWLDYPACVMKANLINDILISILIYVILLCITYFMF